MADKKKTDRQTNQQINTHYSFIGIDVCVCVCLCVCMRIIMVGVGDTSREEGLNMSVVVGTYFNF